MMGQGLLFRQITSCEIVRIVFGWCSFSTAFHHQMALVVLACEKRVPADRVWWAGVAEWKGHVVPVETRRSTSSLLGLVDP
jgi:hypothetical protein